MNDLPSEGYVRLPQIIGNPEKNIPPIIPVSRSTWWLGCKSGRYPKPIKLSKGVTVWKASEIRALVNGGGEQ
jgi:prophage regulatory protein